MENQPPEIPKLSHLESTPPPPSQPPNTQLRKPKTLNLILSLITLTSLSASAYFFYQNHLLEQELASLPINKGVEKEVLSNPTATPDPTTTWQTYFNQAHSLKFNYPPDWELSERPGQVFDNETFGTQITLQKNDATITMHFNMDGIGGLPQTYPGKPFILDGYNLFQYTKTNDQNNPKTIGISNSAETLGVFHINDITYYITLNYPQSTSTNEENILINTFDQILSTFQFINNKDSTFNFSLTIPSSWTGHYRIEKEPDTAKYIFTGSTREYTLFTLGKMSIKEWQAELTKDQPFTAQEVYSNSDIVVYVNRSLDNPLTGEDATQYQQMSSEITTILETFQLEP
jgi:hypothetical protein